LSAVEAPAHAEVLLGGSGGALRHRLSLFVAFALVIPHISEKVIASAFCEAISTSKGDCFIANRAPRGDSPDLWVITSFALQIDTAADVLYRAPNPQLAYPEV